MGLGICRGLKLIKTPLSTSKDVLYCVLCKCSSLFLRRGLEMALAESYDNPNNSRRSKDVLFDEISKTCLDPDELAARLSGVFF